MRISVQLLCGDIPETTPSPLEFAFDIRGKDSSRDARLRLDYFHFTGPDEERNYFFSHIRKEGESLTFFDDPHNPNHFKGSIKKSPCNDGMHEAHYAYEVELQIGDDHYQGCADQIDPFLIERREGKLSNLFKEIGYMYEGKHDPEKMRYQQIETRANLIALMMTWEPSKSKEYEQNRAYLVLRKTNE